MRLFTIFSALLLTPALLAIAHASPCDSDGAPALGIIELPATGVSVFGKAGIYYVDDRNFVTGNGLWIYEETNGWYAGNVSGSTGLGGHLQRGTNCDDSLWGCYWPDSFSSVDPCVDYRPEGYQADTDHL